MLATYDLTWGHARGQRLGLLLIPITPLKAPQTATPLVLHLDLFHRVKPQ